MDGVEYVEGDVDQGEGQDGEEEGDGEDNDQSGDENES